MGILTGFATARATTAGRVSTAGSATNTGSATNGSSSAAAATATTSTSAVAGSIKNNMMDVRCARPVKQTRMLLPEPLARTARTALAILTATLLASDVTPTDELRPPPIRTQLHQSALVVVIADGAEPAGGDDPHAVSMMELACACPHQVFWIETSHLLPRSAHRIVASLRRTDATRGVRG